MASNRMVNDTIRMVPLKPVALGGTPRPVRPMAVDQGPRMQARMQRALNRIMNRLAFATTSEPDAG